MSIKTCMLFVDVLLLGKGLSCDVLTRQQHTTYYVYININHQAHLLDNGNDHHRHHYHYKLNNNNGSNNLKSRGLRRVRRVLSLRFFSFFFLTLC